MGGENGTPALTLRSGAIAAGLAVAVPGAIGGALALAPLAALLGLICAPWRALFRLAREGGPPLAAFAAWFAWTMASALWSPARDLRTAGHLAGGVLTGLLLTAAFGWRPQDRDSALVRQAIVGFAALTAGPSLIEWYGGFPINRLFHWGDPPSLLARAPMMGVAVLAVLVWSAIGILWRWGGRARFAAGALLAATLASAAVTTMDASVIALVLGAGGFAAALALGPLALRLAAWGAAAWLAACPLLARFVLPAIDPTHLPTSWGTRVVVWREISGQVFAHPLFGAGLGAFRKLTRPIETPEGLIQPLHPHSASLQIWFELGVVGAALAAAALVMLGESAARALRAYPHALAAATATWLAAATIANVSYGLWEEWWVATLFFAGGMVAAARFAPASA